MADQEDQKDQELKNEEKTDPRDDLIQKLDKEEIDKIAEIFDLFDKNLDKTVDSKELRFILNSLEIYPNHEELEAMMEEADYGNKGVIDKKDFQKENRQQLFAKIATGNFDAVIIGHSQLGMIPMSVERQKAMIQGQIDDIILGIEELKKSEGSKFQIKSMERTRKSLEKQLSKLEKSHDLQTNDLMKDYLTNSAAEFTILCQNLTLSVFGMIATDIQPDSGGLAIKALPEIMMLSSTVAMPLSSATSSYFPSQISYSAIWY